MIHVRCFESKTAADEELTHFNLELWDSGRKNSHSLKLRENITFISLTVGPDCQEPFTFDLEPELDISMILRGARHQHRRQYIPLTLTNRQVEIKQSDHKYNNPTIWRERDRVNVSFPNGFLCGQQ